MNWYKISLRKHRELENTEINNIQWEVSKLLHELEQLGAKVVSEEDSLGGFSVLDKEGHTIVFNEHSIEMAIRHALARFKFMVAN